MKRIHIAIILFIFMLPDQIDAKRIRTAQRIANLESKAEILRDSVNLLSSNIVVLEDSLAYFSREIAVMKAEEKGFKKSFMYFAPFYSGLILLLVGYSIYTGKGIAKQTAREEIEEVHEKYCNEMEQMKTEAKVILSNIESYHDQIDVFKETPMGKKIVQGFSDNNTNIT